jgi:hypothetical protein
MNTRMKIVTTAKTRIVSHSKEIVVEQPAGLPDLGQRVGIALQPSPRRGDGSTYLYIEQHRGERLLFSPSYMDLEQSGRLLTNCQSAL